MSTSRTSYTLVGAHRPRFTTVSCDWAGNELDPPEHPPYDYVDDDFWSDFTPKLLIEKFEAVNPSPDADRRNTRDTWNFFEHFVRKNSYRSGPSTQFMTALSNVNVDKYSIHGLILNGWRSEQFGSPEEPNKGLPVMYAPTPDGHFVPIEPEVRNLINVAVGKILHPLRPNLSLLNSIYELKDFKTLPRTIEKLKGPLKYLAGYKPSGWIAGSEKRIERVQKRFVRRSRLSVLKAMADIYLQKEFNVQPLLSDIADVQRTLRDLTKRVNDILSQEMKLKRRDFRFRLNGFSSSMEDCSSGLVFKLARDPIAFPLLSRSTRNVRYPKADFHVQIEYNYVLSDFQRKYAFQLAALDGLGVEYNPAIVWNAIRWTFVVDWLLGVSRWLNQFRRGNMDPVTCIHKFCWSQHIKRVISGANSSLGAAPIGLSPQPALECLEESYLRSPYGLELEAALTSSGLSSREFTLASALAVTRLR